MPESPRPRRHRNNYPKGAPSLGAVTITPREIYDLLLELTTTVTGLSSKVDRLLAERDDTTKRLDGHEERLRNLEALRWPQRSLNTVISIVTALVAVGALVVAIIRI